MINIIDVENSEPYRILEKKYKEALNKKQPNIEALCISSFNAHKKEISSRYVNLKYIKDNKFFFFSDYNSPKAIDFKSHNQVAASFYWNSINFQIRIKGTIHIAKSEDSDNHFKNRTIEKNALAISSNQSKPISSYNNIKEKYKESLKDILKSEPLRPEHWGGFYIDPYYFEFWKGHPNRLNERHEFTLKNKIWLHKILEP